jgi:flagellar M-ring protein FliF
MESLRRTFEQFTALYRSMSGSQRATLIAVPLLVVGAFALVMLRGATSSMTAVSYGKQFSVEEIIRAEEAFRQANLDDWERNGRLLMVPQSHVDEYNAVLAQSGGLPDDWTDEWAKSFDSAGPFERNEKLEERKNIALAKIIRKMITLSPDIDDAIVTWARTKERGFRRRGPRVTATVSIRARPGREVSRGHMMSIRDVVAGAISDLTPENVIVVDAATGKTISADDDADPFDNKLMERIRDFQQTYQANVYQSLSYIKDVLVTVSVDLDNVQRSIEQSRKYDKTAAVPTHTVEVTKQQQSNTQPPRVEPGVNANRAPGTTGTTAPTRSSTDDQTTTVTDSVPTATVTHKELIPALPKAVRATVSIPKDYYLKVAAQEGITEGTSDQEKADFKKQLDAIEKTVEADVLAKVARQIPIDENANPEDVISVSSYVRVEEKPPEVETPMTETISRLAGEWGGAVALALLAIWALRMLGKSMPAPPSADENPMQPAALAPISPRPEPELVEEPAPQKEQTPRDRLQSMVRDNPEMAATVLSKWIGSAT